MATHCTPGFLPCKEYCSARVGGRQWGPHSQRVELLEVANGLRDGPCQRVASQEPGGAPQHTAGTGTPQHSAVAQSTGQHSENWHTTHEAKPAVLVDAVRQTRL